MFSIRFILFSWVWWSGSSKFWMCVLYECTSLSLSSHRHRRRHHHHYHYHYLLSERCTGIVDARVRIQASLNSFQVFFSRLHKLRRYLRWCSLHLFLDNTVPIYKFSYIHYFIFSFPGYITNKFTDQFLVSLLAQLFRALHQYRRCQGLNPGKSDFLGFLFATA